MARELVLIVEDNDKNLKLVRDLLQDEGYTTLEATTAADGIQLAAKYHPALILMDIQLPDLDGISARAEIRAHETTASIPVVAVTAYAMADDRARFFREGFDGYIVKPIDTDLLLDEVRRFCDHTAPGE